MRYTLQSYFSWVCILGFIYLLHFDQILEQFYSIKVDYSQFCVNSSINTDRYVNKKIEKINAVKVSTYANSIDNLNINTSLNTNDDQIHNLSWENPLIQDIVDQDSPAIKIRSWTLIKPESVISDIAVVSAWNLGETANI